MSVKDWWTANSKREERELDRLRSKVRDLEQENGKLKEKLNNIVVNSQELLETHQKIMKNIESIKNENAHLKAILSAVSSKHRA